MPINFLGYLYGKMFFHLILLLKYSIEETKSDTSWLIRMISFGFNFQSNFVLIAYMLSMSEQNQITTLNLSYL